MDSYASRAETTTTRMDIAFGQHWTTSPREPTSAAPTPRSGEDVQRISSSPRSAVISPAGATELPRTLISTTVKYVYVAPQIHRAERATVSAPEALESPLLDSPSLESRAPSRHFGTDLTPKADFESELSNVSYITRLGSKACWTPTSCRAPDKRSSTFFSIPHAAEGPLGNVDQHHRCSVATLTPAAYIDVVTGPCVATVEALNCANVTPSHRMFLTGGGPGFHMPVIPDGEENEVESSSNHMTPRSQLTAKAPVETEAASGGSAILHVDDDALHLEPTIVTGGQPRKHHDEGLASAVSHRRAGPVRKMSGAPPAHREGIFATMGVLHSNLASKDRLVALETSALRHGQLQQTPSLRNIGRRHHRASLLATDLSPTRTPSATRLTTTPKDDNPRFAHTNFFPAGYRCAERSISALSAGVALPPRTLLSDMLPRHAPSSATPQSIPSATSLIINSPTRMHAARCGAPRLRPAAASPSSVSIYDLPSPVGFSPDGRGLHFPQQSSNFPQFQTSVASAVP